MKNNFHPLSQISRPGLRCSMAALSVALLLSCTASVKAATLCVDQSGTLTGCFTTISAAIATTGPGDVVGVSPGTYHEQIVITKPLTLIGNNPTTTFIDASGFSNGIYIDGRDNPGLNQVIVRGFTVENANFEGILANNVSDLNISSNTVQNNDKNFHSSGAMCPGLPSFETGENADCGEAIHLMGVTNSTVALNLITGNAGGILLTDETGPNQNNLIDHNIISDNPYSNGITLSSNAAAAPITAPQVTFGVFNNTILENAMVSNGIGGNGGGGVALLAVGAGHSVYSNTVTGNRMVSSGLAGILVHAIGTASGSAPAPNVSNNSLIENFISSNGADPVAGATTPTGVAVYGQSPVLELLIYGNTFDTETVDVFFNSPSYLSIHNNDLVGTTGLVNQNSAGSVNARENFWGCTFPGPGAAGCSAIVGPNIIYSPWLTVSINPPPATPTPTPTPTPVKGTGKGRHCDHDWFCNHYKEHDWFFGFLKDDCDHGNNNNNNNNNHDQDDHGRGR
jgi:hypothetical protein